LQETANHREGALRGVIGCIISWPLTALYWGVFSVLSALSFRKLTQWSLSPVARFWARSILWLMGISLHVDGKERMEERRSRMILTNHQSALDLIWGAAIFPPGGFVVGKKEIIFIPILNLMWWAARCEFIDRGNRLNAIATMQDVAERIREEDATLFAAPEGTRTRDGNMRPFKKGLFHVVIDARVPIYPVVVAGAYELMPRGSAFPKSGHIFVRCLPPIPTESWSKEHLEDHLNEVRDQMVEAQDSLSRERDAFLSQV